VARVFTESELQFIKDQFSLVGDPAADNDLKQELDAAAWRTSHGGGSEEDRQLLTHMFNLTLLLNPGIKNCQTPQQIMAANAETGTRAAAAAQRIADGTAEKADFLALLELLEVGFCAFGQSTPTEAAIKEKALSMLPTL